MSELTLALSLDISDAGRSPNAVRDHAGTAQVDFEVDRPTPADSPPGDLLFTIVKETVILYRKEFLKNEKKGNFFVSLIDVKVLKTLLTARLPMAVSIVQTWLYNMYRNFRQEAHSYRQADI